MTVSSGNLSAFDFINNRVRKKIVSDDIVTAMKTRKKVGRGNTVILTLKLSIACKVPYSNHNRKSRELQSLLLFGNKLYSLVIILTKSDFVYKGSQFNDYVSVEIERKCSRGTFSKETQELNRSSVKAKKGCQRSKVLFR